jgi:hypothetical protein
MIVYLLCYPSRDDRVLGIYSNLYRAKRAARVYIREDPDVFELEDEDLQIQPYLINQPAIWI